MNRDPRLEQLRTASPVTQRRAWSTMVTLTVSVLEHDTSAEQPNCRVCNALALAVLDSLGDPP